MFETITTAAGRYRAGLPIGLTLTGALLLAACSGASGAGPVLPIRPGTAASPREITVIGTEYQFVPPVIDVIPGEVVLIHFVDGGLATHELVLGDAAVQAAWEQAEAAATPAPPGQTPGIAVPAGETGLRLVARSGERVDAVWQVPAGSDPIVAGCHIPGHWAKGMQAPVRLLAGQAGGSPVASTPASQSATAAP